MISDKMTLLKDFMLTHNPYFNQGFEDVILDEETGYVLNDRSEKPEAVFPADNLGNYFYLRLPNNISFDYDTIFKLTDCANEPGIRSTIVLVACMREADPDLLLQNLLSTVLAFKSARIKFLTGSYQDEVIIMQELAKLGKENIQAALARIPLDYTIVSITFSLAVDILPTSLNCIQNPCKTC